MVKKTLSWGEIILGLFFLFYKIPSPEKLISSVIREHLTMDLLGLVIGFIIFLIPILSFLALIDGILRQFDYTLKELIEDLIEKIKEWDN